MVNPISREMKVGTIGELLVKLRFLQYGVQAGPPVSDSGSDLIAVKNDIFRAVQIKTTTKNKFDIGKINKKYHILALVDLIGEGNQIYLDKSCIFLLFKNEVNKTHYIPKNLSDKIICKERIFELFS